MVRWVASAAFASFSLALVWGGVAGLRTGWIHPWERAGVLRPVPHGLGLVFTGSGLLCFTGVLTFTPVGDALVYLLTIGACLFLPGTLLVCVSRFPDRG
ncbi:hypothetical protein ACFXC0_18660 [Streptomyces althioticus]|uniref:hypothetical protein n=1 Tax=Streptomyces althioticus TaxID=83380 RepID=UPI00332CE75C